MPTNPSNSVLQRDIKYLTEEVKNIEKQLGDSYNKIEQKLDNSYVTKEFFDGFKGELEATLKPVMMTVYGIWGLIGVGIVLIIAAMIMYYIRMAPPGGL